MLSLRAGRSALLMALSCAALACKRRGEHPDEAPAALAVPPGPPPAPRFFPRLTAEQMPPWLPGLRFGDSTAADVRAALRVELAPAQPAPRTQPYWASNAGPAVTQRYGVGDATGQLHMLVHCGTYTMAAGPGAVTFAQLRIEASTHGAAPNLPSPLPALPANFVDPPDPAAAPARPAPVAAPAAPAAVGPAGPEEPGIMNLPDTWYCSAGTHTFANLRLAGRAVGVAGQCRLTLTGCTLSRNDTVVRVSGEGVLTMSDCRVTSDGATSVAVTVSENGTLNLTGGEVRSRGDGLFAFGNARAEVDRASIVAGASGSALNFSGRARATVRGSTLNRPNLVADRARVRDGGGNTGFASR